MKEIQNIVIHMTSAINEDRVETSKYIRIKDTDGKSSVERINMAINALESIRNEYEINNWQ